MKRTLRTAYVALVSLTLTAQVTYSQTYSQWEGYPAMNVMSDVTLIGDTVFGAAANGLFACDTTSGESTAYYRNHGLDAGDLTAVAASDRYVYVGFESDGLMRFDPSTGEFDPILFPEYINDDDVTQSIAISDIVALGDTVLYVAHSEGIDRLDLVNEGLRTYSQLSFDFDNAISVIDIEVFDGTIWAGTEQGLAWADIDDPSLESPSAWESFAFGTTRYPAAVNSILKHVNGSGDSILYVGTGSRGIIEFNPATGDTVTSLAATNIRHLAHGFGTVVAASLYEGYFVQENDSTWTGDDSFEAYMRLKTGPDGNVWAATGENGLQCITETGLADIKRINLPDYPTIYDIEVASGGDLWISTAYRDQGGHIQAFQDGTWSSFSSLSPRQLKVTNAFAVDSYGRLWGSCWGAAVYTADITAPAADFPASIVEVDPDHEFIASYTAGSTYVVSPDITVDDNDNIWVAGFTNGLYVFDGELPIADNQHQQFVYDDASAAPYIMTVHTDPDGWVWLGTYETGLIGQWVGPDPYDTSDDEHVYFSGGGDSDDLLGSRVFTAVPDLDGDVWVGTDGGLNRIVKISDGTFDIIDESGLLDDNALVVYAVAIDAAGSKWIGTSGGLYRISRENIQTAVYTVDNSGLISDRVLSVVYDPVGRRMLVGTDSGLNVFDAFGDNGDTGGDVAYVYPNPFEIWGSDSQATFAGLDVTALLRIFTFNGELVVELEPEDNGDSGSAMWDGCNYRGESVGSGIYFFTGVDANGQKFQSKMAVIRR